MNNAMIKRTKTRSKQRQPIWVVEPFAGDFLLVLIALWWL